MWVVCDLDGTLAEDWHRAHLATAQLWDEFHAALATAKLIKPTARLVEAMSEYGYPTMLLTTRPEQLLCQTEAWLQQQNVRDIFNEIISRPEGNLKPAAQLKLDLLIRRFGSEAAVREKVLVVLEDRADTIKAMREFGLTVHEVCKGEY
jgi:hypothetical protein